MKFSTIFAWAIVIMLASTTTSFAQTVTEKIQVAENTKTITTKVKGVTCPTDLKMIVANVEKLEGVNTCKTGKPGMTTTFEIAYDPALITEKKIYAAIQNTGTCEDPNDKHYKVKQ